MWRWHVWVANAAATRYALKVPKIAAPRGSRLFEDGRPPPRDPRARPFRGEHQRMSSQSHTPPDGSQEWATAELVYDVVGARQAKRRMWFWIVALAVCGGLGMVALTVLAGALLIWSAKSIEVTPADRQLVVTVDELLPWLDDFSPDYTAESLEKTRYFDGSWEVEYSYDHTAEDTGLFISSTVAVEPTLQDAQTSYASMGVGLRIGFSLQDTADMKLTDRDDLFRWGDQSQCTLITIDGRPVGNIFLARHGKRIFCVVLSGLAMEDSASLGQLLMPHLERITGDLPERL